MEHLPSGFVKGSDSYRASRFHSISDSIVSTRKFSASATYTPSDITIASDSCELVRYSMPCRANKLCIWEDGRCRLADNSGCAQLEGSGERKGTRWDIGADRILHIYVESWAEWENDKPWRAPCDQVLGAQLFGATSIRDYEFLGLKHMSTFQWTLERNSRINLLVSGENWTIGRGAFRGTGLEELEVPSQVVSIGDECFWNCTKLRKIVYNGATNITGNLFDDDNTEVVIYVSKDYPSEYWGGRPVTRQQESVQGSWSSTKTIAIGIAAFIFVIIVIVLVIVLVRRRKSKRRMSHSRMHELDVESSY